MSSLAVVLVSSVVSILRCRLALQGLLERLCCLFVRPGKRVRVDGSGDRWRGVAELLRDRR